MQFKLSDLNRFIIKVQLLQDVSSIQYDYKINNADDVDQLVVEELRMLDREHFLAIYLRSRNKVIDIESPDYRYPDRNVCATPGSFKSAILGSDLFPHERPDPVNRSAGHHNFLQV